MVVTGKVMNIRIPTEWSKEKLNSILIQKINERNDPRYTLSDLVRDTLIEKYPELKIN